jgi:cytochrome c
VKLASGNRSKLAAQGRQLWNDPSLSSNGMSCNSCHVSYASLNPSFAKPYPHRVAMPSQMAGTGKISADEMVQFCMLVPMQSKTLPWSSTQLAALTAYTHELQKEFKANPCAAKKACSPCNPCGAGKVCNPCNPCAVKKSCNPCNPCAPKKSPCSPCNPCAVQKTS